MPAQGVQAVRRSSFAYAALLADDRYGAHCHKMRNSNRICRMMPMMMTQTMKLSLPLMDLSRSIWACPKFPMVLVT